MVLRGVVICFCEGRVSRPVNGWSQYAAYRECGPPFGGRCRPITTVSSLALGRAARRPHPLAPPIQTISAAHALRFFGHPALAHGDGNSRTASPSWRESRSGWRYPSNAGIAGLWLFPFCLPQPQLSAMGVSEAGAVFRFRSHQALPPHFANPSESWTLRFFIRKPHYLKQLRA